MKDELVKRLDKYLEKHSKNRGRHKALEIMAQELDMESPSAPLYWVGVKKVPKYRRESLDRFLTKEGF